MVLEGYEEEDIEIESIEAFLKLAISSKPFLEYKGVRLGILDVHIDNNFMDIVNGLVSGRCEVRCTLGGFIDKVYHKTEGILLVIGTEGKALIRIVHISKDFLFCNRY